MLLFLAISRACSEVEPGVGTMQANAPHIAVIDVQGLISPDDDANAYDIGWALTEAYENEAAKAVVLNINSPEAVVVSIAPSEIERKPTFLIFRSSTIDTK